MGKFKRQFYVWKQKYNKIKKMLRLGDYLGNFFKKMIKMNLQL